MVFVPKLGFDVTPVIAVNEGASFGPRIATATFSNTNLGQGPRWTVRIVADLDGSAYQDESAVRRRGGRAAVPVGRRAAAKIETGVLAPSLEVLRRDPDRAQAVWQHEESFEGYSRRVIVTRDFACDGQMGVALMIPVEFQGWAVRAILHIADRLHMAIDDPAYAFLFGGR